MLGLLVCVRFCFLWLANCYFAHNSLRFPALLPFFNASSGRPFHPLGASNPSAPSCNRIEALDTASLSQSHEQAKIPHAVLIEAPPEARPERTERTTRSCGRRNEAT